MAILTITGMYNYDNTLFDDITVPDQMDKDELINTILFQNAELELVYTQPKTLKAMVNTWAKTSYYTWDKLAKTLNLEYNPIWNKDGTIEETESVKGSGTGIGQVSAFDSTDFENRDKSTAESESERTYKRIEQGNIGVTSTQQLIKEERETALFNIYDIISEDFKNKFCLMVY